MIIDNLVKNNVNFSDFSAKNNIKDLEKEIELLKKTSRRQNWRKSKRKRR